MNTPCPVYDRDGITVYHADCRDILSMLPTDAAIVTDPPYGVDWKHSGHAGKLSRTGKAFGIKIRGDDQAFDPALWLKFPSVAFTGAQYFYDRLPAGGSLHVWNKRGHYMPLDHGDGDVVWISRKSACRVFDLVWRGICRHAEHDQKIVHPTQKPVALMRWIMLDLLGLSDECTIVDPYAGSGSTLVAAAKAGRRAIGIESDPRYIPVIIRRLQAAETPLFNLEGPQP